VDGTPLFKATCWIPGILLPAGEGMGSNKKRARQLAAYAYMQMLNDPTPWQREQ